MTQSLKDIIIKAVPQYYEVEFGSWITKWPGQVVLVGMIINNFLAIIYFKTNIMIIFLHMGLNTIIICIYIQEEIFVGQQL